MMAPRFLVCLGIFALAAASQSQTSPTVYTITQGIQGDNSDTMTIYRNGSQAVIEYKRAAKPDGTPASRSLSLFDLKAGVNHSWNPGVAEIPCSVGTFSGDWGDPFTASADVTSGIAKGELKPAGAETVNGIPTKVYTGSTQGMNLKAWVDPKDNLVIKAAFGAPGGPMTTMINIRSVSFAPPPAAIFALPPACASLKPPPTPAELIAAETGDNAANYVNANYGPGTKASCSIVIRVVAAKTMAPVTRRWQAAIDTTYNQDDPNPPHYTFGVGNDGTSTFSGGGLHEITSQIHNDMLRIDNPPAYFNLAVNVVQPGHGTSTGLFYRQCFYPTTMLYYVLKDPDDPGKGGDYLYAKAGKYATVPTH
jgi:hypothetical protein